MELHEMKLEELKDYAKKNGVDITGARTKTALIKAITEHEQDKPKPMVALYADHNLFHPKLGRFEKGYQVLTQDEADIWLKAVGRRLRVATPQEVAAYYGV